MEKINRSKEIKDFPPATLYLDDLIEIVGILAKACGTIEVESGDYKITDLTEIDDLAKKFTSGRFDDIKLTGHAPHVRLRFHGLGIRAHIDEDSAEQRGVIEKIRDVVIKGKKKDFKWIYQVPALLCLALSLMIMMLNKGLTSAFLLLVASVLCSTLAFLRTVKAMNNNVVVHTENRGTSKSFFERNRDDFIKKALYAAFTGAGVLIMYLFQRVFPSLFS